MAPASLTSVYSHPQCSSLSSLLLSLGSAQASGHSGVQVCTVRGQAMVWSGREDTWVHAAVLPLHGARGAPASLPCSDAEKIRPDLATPAFGLTPRPPPTMVSQNRYLPRHCQVQSSEPCPQSNPGALLFSSPWISWHTAFPAGFKGTPGREAAQSMNGT